MISAAFVLPPIKERAGGRTWRQKELTPCQFDTERREDHIKILTAHWQNSGSGPGFSKNSRPQRVDVESDANIVQISE